MYPCISIYGIIYMYIFIVVIRASVPKESKSTDARILQNALGTKICIICYVISY